LEEEEEDVRFEEDVEGIGAEGKWEEEGVVCDGW